MRLRFNPIDKNSFKDRARYVDLHTHTFYSDGLDDPRTIVRAARMKGIEVLAITDHDNLKGYFEAVEEAEFWGIDVISGVEVTTEKYHILGLNVAALSEGFEGFLSKIRGYQKNTCQKRIDTLYQNGVPITMEKVEEAFPESRLGKQNILMTLIKDPACEAHLNKKHPRISTEGLFGLYLGKGGVAAKVQDKQEVSAEEAIYQIQKAGGIAVLAHPFKDVDEIEEVDRLRRAGLDGIEIQPNYGGRNMPFREYAEDYKMIMTYGSDYHGAFFDRPLLGRGENQIFDIDELFDENRKEEMIC